MGGGLNVPTIPGTPFAGGFYVGRMAPGDGNKYALIVAPKAQGEFNGALSYRSSNLSTSGAGSAWDGASNSAALAALGAGVSPIADFMQQVNNGGGIGGYTDWFIGARYQNEMIYRNLKTGPDANNTGGPGTTSNAHADPNTPAYTASSPVQTDVAAFMPGGAEAYLNNNYWSSSEFPTTEAWVQDMYTGYFTHYSKTLGQRVRLVRMIKI
jgi:hypothetical protein